VSNDTESEYDTFGYAPDRIDAIAANGLVAMHEALSEENTAKLESMPIENQGIMLWKLVEEGTIDVDLSEDRR
jgi:hypothetical protein